MSGSRKRVPKAYRRAHSLAFSPLLFQAAMSARNMGVLDAVHAAASEGISPTDVATKAGVSYYAARVLLEGCLALELVTHDGARYRITDTGHLWLFDEMTKINANFVQDVCYAGAAGLEESLRTGKPAGLKVFGEWDSIYEGVTKLPSTAQKSWYEFDHFYSDGVYPLAYPRVFEADPPKRLLEAGGNTGKWALYCMTRDPDVEFTILDHPGQLARLEQNVAAAGFASRLHTIPGNLLDHSRAFPTGFDMVWMSQFLDCFGEDDILRLLERGRAALAPGGRFCILEAFWDRQANEVGELVLQGTSLYFSCMANATSRMYHSQDFLDLIPKAGLRVVADEAIGHSHTLLTCATQMS
jgi:SAM-dependent methyltransferase/predicted transcriptional regulator